MNVQLIMLRWLSTMVIFIITTTVIYFFTNADESGYLIESAVFSLVYPDVDSVDTYNLEALSISDYHTLIDIKEFKFLINNFPCNKSHPQLLILVSSAPNNYDLRMAVRNTWGKTNEHVKLLFLLGDVSLESKININVENERYKDIIQGNFLDSYRNMTYKQVMGLKWSSYFCTGAKYILKTDDDVFVNIHELEDFLVTQFSPWGARNLIMCDIFFKNPVFRSYRSKWRVSFDEYSDHYFPPYCAGYAILYSPDVLFKIYKEAQLSKYFWIDDVHLTGILREKLQLELTQSAPMTLSRNQIAMLLTPFSLFVNLGKYLYGAPDVSQYFIQSFWKYNDAVS